MKYLLMTLFLINSSLLGGQVVADFENFDLPLDTFLNGSNALGSFASGQVILPNDYSEEFDSWMGWAISSARDDSTPGFQNQYSAIAGAGADLSDSYAVSFSFEPNIIHLRPDALGKPVESLMVTNATYPFLSMRDGDAFAKRFGGVDGDDPDYFLLTIKKYYNGIISEDSIDFYLADYRFSDNSEDYIVSRWTKIDLSELGPVDSLWLSLSSTDVGMFGMNTPAYFCVDNIITSGPTTSVGEAPEFSLTLFPNPCIDFIKIKTGFSGNAEYRIVNSTGTCIKRGAFDPSRPIEVSQLITGIYQFQMLHPGLNTSLTFVKEN